MAGPNLELVKFGIYVFFPVAIMLHYGNPDWYQTHIIPYRERFWPTDPRTTNTNVPHSSTELSNEIAALKLKKLRERQAAANASAEPTS
ncbi:hypothetical protein FS837_009153 [Tulasnella sp. UAMH 9824]|nr:hypothetical protein FS837_009153 [Tulasnella sp. UAMH 9824]